MSNGTWRPASMNVRLPRGSWMRGKSMTRQSLIAMAHLARLLKRPHRRDEVDLEKRMHGAGAGEAALEPIERLVQATALLLVGDAEVEPTGALGAGSRHGMLEQQVQGAGLAALGRRCAVLAV